MFVVDLRYPPKLHLKHSDYPLAVVHLLLGHRAPRVKVGLRVDWERAAPPSGRYGSGNRWGGENIPRDLGEGKSGRWETVDGRPETEKAVNGERD